MKNPDQDFATAKPISLNKPEERVRQEYERILHVDFGYPKECMDIEVPIQIGSRTYYCDIAIYASADKRDIIGIVETKASGKSGGQSQLHSYMSATASCRWGVWTDGDFIECASLDDARRPYSDAALSVPRYGEQDAIIKSYDDLVEASNLKFIFRIINNRLYANTNLARTERQGAEMVRFVFCKLEDEYNSQQNTVPEFQVKAGESERDTRQRIISLWNRVKGGPLGSTIFSQSETITIDNYSLRLIVSTLQRYSLRNTNKDVVGDAFQVFSERQFAGEKGQFFTPRAVVNMIIRMLEPKPNEQIIDPACGSGGFLLAAFNYITQGVDAERKKSIAEHCLFGIDKEGDLSKICKAHMCILGDGKSNIVTADSLKFKEDWSNEASSKLLVDDELRQFDVVVTNPPFGSKIKVEHEHVLAEYCLAHKWKVNGNGDYAMEKDTQKTPPQVLFIERCLALLKPGGRMGIVLPDGLLGNPRDGYIRHWLLQRADILAVVDCPAATFMPHTGTKTSVLLIRKHGGDTKAQPTFFAIAEHCGHSMRGEETEREDFSAIAENYIQGCTSKHLGFYPKRLTDNILVPKYYDPRILSELKQLKAGHQDELVSIGELIAAGKIEMSGMAESIKAEEYDAHGAIRYIRTADISALELHDNTKQRVSESTYLKYCKSQDLQVGDILFVKDGDNRIGETAIILDEYDKRVLVQGHFWHLRPKSINPFLLLWLLNRPIVQKQIRQRVFIQSTLGTIGSRIKELLLPIPKDKKQTRHIINEVETLVRARRVAIIKLHECMRAS